jgi:uncharacterized protein (DUF2147 family)
MKQIALTVLVGLLVGPCAGFAQSLTGVWIDKDRNTFELADAGTVSGKIRSLIPPTTEASYPLLDIHNPDPAKRQVPLVGLVFMRGFKPDGDQMWDGGTIYDPRSGRTYSCTLQLEGADQLKVHGYFGVSLLGRTELWTRLPDSR